MTTVEALRVAVTQAPEDAAPVLVLADCLDENGDPDGAADERLIARALAAGWTWHEGLTTWPGSPQYPATGWMHGSSFQNCKPHQKATALRAELHGPNPGRGFNHGIDCGECGKPVWLSWLKPCEDELIARRECFDCNHWLGFVRMGGGLVIARDGHRSHYQVGTGGGEPRFRGFGGAKHRIRLADGRVIETTDLWHQGRIPERFWDRLPVNAEFVS